MRVRCHSEKWRRSLHFDADSLADGAAHVIHMLIVQDSKKPSSQISSCLPQVLLGDRARQAALNEIVCPDRVTGQCTSITTQPRDLCFNQPTKVIHRKQPVLLCRAHLLAISNVRPADVTP